MGFVEGVDRHQMVMFPEMLDDYVADDNPVRFVDAFVDSLDLRALGFERAVPKETGRPPYNPAILLKLYIYGYLNRISLDDLMNKRGVQQVASRQDGERRKMADVEMALAQAHS